MPPIRPPLPLASLALVPLLLAAAPEASAQSAGEAERWLAGVHDRVAADLRAGRPLVVQAHVPLCDSRILRCGNERLGDGDAPATNLYWATSGGFRGWFNRRGSGWTEVYRGGGQGQVLEVRVWRRRLAPGRAFRDRGVKRAFDVYVVAHAWRGTAIRDAMDAYVTDIFGDGARAVKLANGSEIRAGGAAHVIAYVGHNGWMDFPDYDFAAVVREAGGSSAARGSSRTLASPSRTWPDRWWPRAACRC
jgi:hypothetical protein